MSNISVMDRAIEYGVDSLTSNELMSVALNQDVKPLPDETLLITMCDAMSSMRSHKIGLTKAQCIQLQAFRECYERMLCYQLKKRQGPCDRKFVRKFLSHRLRCRHHEVFAVMLLDSRYGLIDYLELFRGSPSRATIYPGEVVKTALAHDAHAVIIAHNHPSGHTEPSRADHDLTSTLKKALEIVDIGLFDHIIIAGSDTVSFEENGWL